MKKNDFTLKLNNEGGDVMVNFEYKVVKLSEVFSVRDTDVFLL